MPANQPAPEGCYRQRAAQFEDRQRRFLARGEQLSWVRVACALGFAGVLLGGWDGRAWSWESGLVGGAILMAAFAACVAVHRGVRQAANRAGMLAWLNRQALARVVRNWSELAPRRAPASCEQDALGRDLDLFGRASLFQLVSTATTPLGAATLGRWLLESAPPEEIRQRQQAVRELAGMLDWRQELEFLGMREGGGFTDPRGFLDWAEGSAWLALRPALSFYGKVALASLGGLVAAAIAGVPTGPGWGLLILANLAATAKSVRPIHAIFSRLSAGEAAFARYAALLDWACQPAFRAPRLQALRGRLQVDGQSAAAHLRRLERWITLSDLRHSSMLYGPLQTLTLWDVHVLRGVEAWQRRHGGKVRDWLAALGELEALASLAALAHAEPTWVDATWHEVPQLQAACLGHPLLAGASRVGNDVEMGPPGTFLLVTGSNMSGKSTLLRSIGVNVLLAQAGGPVCAASLRMPPLCVGTSMRVQDSLEECTSHFLAELKRLKQVIDAAASGTQVFLFLLDEILHGTNSGERRIAVRAVLTRLLSLRAIGAVSTHDLELANAPEFVRAAQRVHFRESTADTQNGPVMTFDYRMRPGLATTTNALRLLEWIGLSAPTEKLSDGEPPGIFKPAT